MSLRREVVALLLLAVLSAPGVRAGEVASANLNIVGIALETQDNVSTGADIPAVIQTKFGGQTGDAVVGAEHLAVLGELSGPGLDAPIPVRTTPGGKFTLPPLHEQGDYTVSNIRLVDESGKFVQSAVPTYTAVHVVGTLNTTVTIKQLTPDDLRARGISIDSRNYDVYDYNFIFAINNQTITVPYPVIIDRRTHEVVPAPAAPQYALPIPPPIGAPPRFQPPQVIGLSLSDEDLSFDKNPPDGEQGEFEPKRRHPSIPAAIVIPTGFGVLHQFFAVIVNVSNGAPEGSNIVLDSVKATITTPTALRVVKVNPSVSIGQAVPILNGKTGDRFLVALAEGSADWSLEALRTGTHTVDVDIRATYQAPNQAEVALHGKVSSSIVVSDPTFQINFVHPDNVRSGEPYTAYAMITNTSPQRQTVKIDLSSIPPCEGTGAGYNFHLCRTDNSSGIIDKTFTPGQTIPIPYKLKPNVTGHVYAAAGDSPEGISTTVTLSMGVSETGIPLSPATLLLPHYAQYVSTALVEGHMPILGLGYSLATAPMLPSLAAFPRLIQNDVFTRAQDIARAGERIFVARQALNTDSIDEDREPMFHLALDLLGNVERLDRLAVTADMHEWDQLRRMEQDGRAGGAAMARELERVGLANGRTMPQFAADFAQATSHRTPFVMALVHGAPVAGVDRPYALALAGAKTSMTGIAESAATAVRTLPYGELTKFTSATEAGELVLVGRWSETLTLTVTPASPSFTLELIYPGATDGSFLRGSVTVNGATPGTALTMAIERGKASLVMSNGSSLAATDVAQSPLVITGAAQDLHLDPAGHIVTMLFNRPVTVADADKLRNLFELTTSVPTAGYSVKRKNDPAKPLQPLIPGAALQDDGRMLNISFDHALSTHASYSIAVDPIADARVAGRTISSTGVVPRIDNDAPGGVVVGKLLLGDGSPVNNALITLDSNKSRQWDTTVADGSFLFEFIPRNINVDINGAYHLETSVEGRAAKLDGVIRVNGEVQRIVLQFLGRGSAKGHVGYSDGTPLANAPVTVGSTTYGEFHRAVSNADGDYTVDDLPVGPLTFAVQDPNGNVCYAASQIKTPGEVVTQNLVIQKRDLAGLGTVRITVRRSDLKDSAGNLLIVSGAHVGVYTQGYGLVDGYTDVNGQFEFTKIPAGFISILAAEFSLTRESAGVELDLKPDSVIEQTLILHVPTAAEATQYAIVSGIITRDDPTAPSNHDKDTLVNGGIVSVGGLANVVSGADGRYTIENVPTTFAGKKVRVFDPATGRTGVASLPGQLTPGVVNPLPIRLETSTPQGYATFKVRVFSASGTPVTRYHVLWPGIPPNDFTPSADGYELANVKVPTVAEVWAVPVGRDRDYGDQVAHGTIRADFDGQVATLDLRLPGQGTIKARILQQQSCPESNPTCTPGYGVAAGDIGIAYSMWNDIEQGMVFQERPPVKTDAANGGYAVIDKVPVGSASIETIDHPGGYASDSAFIAFEGDVKERDLKLDSLGTVTGRVVNYDGQTPVGGASLTFDGSGVHVDGVFAKADGSFSFPAMAGAQSFRVSAEALADGITRKGYVDGRTPDHGGPVNGLVLVMRQQANVSGKVVDATGALVPQARYWARELNWPYRNFGSPQDPLIAGNDGRFFLNNLFSGGVRITAQSPIFQEQRGDAQTAIAFEGDNKSDVDVNIGGAGTSSLTVTVVDSNNAYSKVPNAEVTLVRNNSAFDFGTTDANGVVFFDQLPAGETYAVRATSKVVGRAGVVTGVTLVRDVPATRQVALTLTGLVSGTLVDGDEVTKPIVKGAPVYLYSPTLNTVTSTDGLGAFLFNGVPEGTFNLDAIDLDSGRHARNKDPLFISTLFPDRTNIQLELDKTATLNVGVYLPDDHGDSSGVLAPFVDISVHQGFYSRELQSAGEIKSFPKMFPGQGYSIDVKELGGGERTMHAGGVLPAAGDTVSLVFKTTGSVWVQVSAPQSSVVEGSRVSVSAGGRGITVYCDASGLVKLNDLPLGPVSVQVVSGALSASGSGDLSSHTVPLVIPVTLGSLASIDGYVDAEVSGVSAGTRVVADVSSTSGFVRLETRTDGTGAFSFSGIPVSGTHVTMTYYGPDDVTVGAALPNVEIPAGTTGTFHMKRVRLDATPPTVIALFPSNNANSVAPNAQVLVTFSEPLDPSSVTAGNFVLRATDDGVVADTSVLLDAGAARVRITPNVPLKSNVIYSLKIATGVLDTTGNHLKAEVASNFTTVNYTEPKITSVTPSTALPIDDGATFRLKFNKPIDLHSYDAGVGGVAKLEQLDAPNGNVIAELTLVRSLDNLDASVLILAPTMKILPSSFYRVTVSGTRDAQTPPNIQKDAQTYSYSSVDTVFPTVTIGSPVAAGVPLVAGATYSIKAAVFDENTTDLAKDVKYVDWFTTDGTTDTAVARTAVGPDYSYLLHVPVGVTSVTLKASATDLSFHQSALASFTWSVIANQPPQNVTFTTSAATAYLKGHIDTATTFTDEGTLVTASLAVTGKKTNGDDYPLPASLVHPSGNQQVQRPSTSAPWTPSPVTFGVDLPADLKEGTPLHFVLTVKDSDQQVTTKTADVDVLTDNTAPVVVSLDPKPETHYKYVTGATNTFPIVVKVKDAESGVAHVRVTHDGNDVDLTSGTYDAATATWTFTTNGKITAKNADTRVRITATAFDYHGNSTPVTADVIYESVNDGTLPVAQWISPLDGAALPAGTDVTLKLQLHATDDVHVDKVAFTSSAFSSTPAPLTAPTRGGNIYEQTVTFKTPAAGTPLVITATVSDSDPGHDVTLPISIDPVTIDVAAGDAVLTGDASIQASNAAQYTNHNLVVSGAGTDVYIKVPLTLKNLIVLDGGHVGNPDRIKLDLTISEHLFVDADSSIDVSGKGYLGAWQTSEDGTVTNSSPRGMTLGGSSTNGPLSSSASHAGLGSHDAFTPTNATYGSITDPADFGAGGGGAPIGYNGGNVPGGNGGGAVLLHAGGARVALAGALRADGAHGFCGSPCIWGPGAGGSVSLTAGTLITGYASRISANGGDDNAFPNVSAGAGGGRVAVRVSDRLDLDPTVPVLQARGGRDGGNEEGSYTDAGAGTVFLLRPGSTNGALIVSSFDERHPSSTHRTLGTPIAAPTAGTLAFDSITIGPRALARFDDAYTVPAPADFTADPTALVLAPADQPLLTMSTSPAGGANVVQDGNVVVTYTATSVDGIHFVRLPFTASAAETVDFTGTFPATITNKQTPVTVSSTAALGNASLQLSAESRSGRTVQLAPVAFTVVANVKPTIDSLVVTPDSLYAGHSYTATVTASDDLSVTSVSAASAIGTVTAPASVTTSGSPVTKSFTVTIPPTASGSDTFTISVHDGFAGRAPVTQTATIAILQDASKPSIAFTTLPPNRTVVEGAGFTVDATVTDAESGVKTVTMTFNGATTPMTLVSGSLYRATLTAPSVDGGEPVPMTATVTATDFGGNALTAVADLTIQPISDATAPTITWACGSTGILAPANLTLTLKAFIKNPSTSNSSTATLAVDGNTLFSGAPAGDGSISATYKVPVGALAGDKHTVLVTATALGGGTETLSTVITVVDGTIIPTGTSTITAGTDTTGSTYIVLPGATLIVNGTHSFKTLVVYGTLVPQSADLLHADSLTVDTIYVGCGGVVDASSYSGRHLGFGPSTTWPGAGTPGDSAGGGHIGRGGLWGVAVGGSFGSIYRPMEPGGGGQNADPNYEGANGGGVVRLIGNTVTVDGIVRANAQENGTWGSGAGGSVYVTANRLAGAGVISTLGGTWNAGVSNDRGAGGGGALSLEYQTTSGTILNNLYSYGGYASGQGAAGTVFVKGPQSVYGDLSIYNAFRTINLPPQVVTDLPDFGTATVTSVPAPGTAVLSAPWEGTWFAGHYLTVTAADGTPRGTVRIASVTNDPSVRTINGVLAVPVQTTAYSGYLLYSDAGYPAGAGAKKVVPVRNVSGAWQYDNGTTLVPFTPQTGDALFASFTRTASSISSVQFFTCNGACTPVQGLPALALVRGEVVMNAAMHFNNCCPIDQPFAGNGFLLDRDAQEHGLTLSGGLARVTLDAGASLQVGDTVRGTYLFDHVTVKNARVYTNDLVVSTAPPSIEAGSTWVTGNLAAPVIDASKLSFAMGPNGPMLVGAPGAVKDSEAGTLEVYARNTARALPAPAFVAGSSYTLGTGGGFSGRKVPNGNSGIQGNAQTAPIVTGYAYLQGRPSSTNKHMDMTIGEYDFAFFESGYYNVWINGRRISDTPYSPDWLFRIEKTPTTVTFLVNGQVVYTTTTDSTPRRFVIASWDDNGEINSVEYGVDNAQARFSSVAAADGSFSVPIHGAPGDAISANGRDRHPYALLGAEKAVGVIPANIGVSGISFSTTPATGGRALTGTATLLSLPGVNGVTLNLASSSAAASVPATLTIPAGSLSATFPITTQPVAAPTSATISATWGGVTTTAVLSVVQDATPPSVTVTSPSAGAQYSEGTANAILVRATVTDADSGVQSVFATLDGTDYPMAAGSGGVYSVTLNAPFVDGTTNVTKNIVVTATDKTANVTKSDPVAITIVPVSDSSMPVVAWKCLSSGAMLPYPYTFKPQIVATPPNATNILQKVELLLLDASGSTLSRVTATAVSGVANTFEAPVTVPDAAEGTSFTLRALATTVSGTTALADSTFSVVRTNVVPVSGTVTLSAADTTTYDNKTVVVTGGTFTIAGAHTFTRLLVLDGATVVPPATSGNTISTLDVTAGALYVSCGGTIDATGRGYGASVSYPGASLPGNGSGGSHIGLGGLWNPPLGSTYGSVYAPREAGAGGEFTGTAGGGVLRLHATALALDGAIRANGDSADGESRGGAGGSIWITTSTVSGSGVVETNGGHAKYGTGGGGAVAVEYTSGTLPWKLNSTTNYSNVDQTKRGGAGSIYVKGPGSTYGTLTVDGTYGVVSATDLPSLGKGLALTGSSGATLITDRGVDIPAYFAGHWIEVTDSVTKVLKGTWRIATISARSVTLAPNGGETVNVAAGDGWQGVYRFDNLVTPAAVVISGNDPIRLGAAGTVLINGPTAAGQTLDVRSPITGIDVTLSGNVTVQGSITASSSLTLKANTLLTSASVPLTLTTPGTLTIESGAVIDLTGRGYGASTSYPGATIPGNGSGGSHIGIGGLWNLPVGSTYGSVYRPQEAGAGGEFTGTTGGGVLRINAGTFTYNGTIRANGVSGDGESRGGAGGSVWITANTIAGTGAIETNGGHARYGTGGGGAISIEYAAGTMPAWQLASTTNYSSSSPGNQGGAGSIYIKGPQSTYGTLTVDTSFGVVNATSLPALGGGTAQIGSSGATLVTDRTVDIPAYFAGHWIEITDASNVLKGTWRIDTISARTVTLVPNAGETINVAAGDHWQGVYRFDTVIAPAGATILGSDPIRFGANGTVVLNGPTAAGTMLDIRSPLAGSTVTLSGNLTLQSPITATASLTLQPGLLTSASVPLTLNAPGTMTVEPGAIIDLTGRGYAGGTTYPGATLPANGSGGSHLGVGGLWDLPTGSTFGSIYRPQELGGGGDNGGNAGLTGGGVLRISAGALTHNGVFRADGNSGDGESRGGAGGSIWITANSVAGGGLVRANGGHARYGTGAGGSIAIEYASGTMPLLVAATTNTSNSGSDKTGSAGSLYLRGAQSVYGDLVFDNGTFANGPNVKLPSLGRGVAAAGSSGATLLTGRSTAIPAYFAGHWVEISDPNDNVRGVWRIASVNGTTVTLAPNGSETIPLQPGDQWAGIYRFDNVKLRKTVVVSGDRLDVTNPKDLDGSSALTVNDGPPKFPAALRSQVMVISSLAGDRISAPAGAVVDVSTPITLAVTSSHGVVVTATAAADGSFNIPVTGPIGETFTITATDSHAVPLTSAALAVSGQIVNTNGVASVTLQPQSVTGGTSALASVRLLGLARTGGVVVALSSSGSAAVVPPSVTVAAGVSTATFTITTTAAPAQAAATITASTGVAAQNATLTVIPSGGTLASVVLTPSSITAGATATAAVTLSAPAPAGGAIVSLASSNASVASVPVNVVVPEGALSASFSITAAATGSANIIGTYGLTQSAPLTVTGCTTMSAVTPPASAPLDVVWVDDALPAGAAVTGLSLTTAQAASGTQSIVIAAGTGAHQGSFANATATIAPGATDRLVTYALINPCNPPRQILFVWNDGTNEYRNSWGDDLIEATVAHTRVSSMPAGGQWARLEVPASVIGANGKALRGLTIKLYDGEAWFDRIGISTCVLGRASAPAAAPGDRLWVDDQLPTGAVVAAVTNWGTYNDLAFTWDTGQSAGGAQSHRLPLLSGFHQHSFNGAVERLRVGPGDMFVSYVLLDPCNPPRELMLQWNDGNGWEHRAFWGDDAWSWGNSGTPSRYHAGPLPEAGKWVRLEVPAAAVGLENTSIAGQAWSLVDGQAWFDRDGVVSRVNLALGKVTRQSSTLDNPLNPISDRAVDGNISGNYNDVTVTHTAGTDNEPFWQVDLGAVSDIDNVELWNRTDCCSDRLRNFWLFVSDHDFAATTIAGLRAESGVYAYVYPGQVGRNVNFLINRPGRFVRVQLASRDYLQLAEVQVWAPATAGKVNLAGGRPASASSVLAGFNCGPERAVNGNTNPHFYNELSVFINNGTETAPWFDVDLGSVQPLSTIELGNRSDYAPEWLTKFYVFVSDNPFPADNTIASTIAQNGVTTLYHGTNVSIGYTLPVNRTGRYVRVQMPTPQSYIQLNEVQVWSQQNTLQALTQPSAPEATGSTTTSNDR
jgi:hypothetical protein